MTHKEAYDLQERIRKERPELIAVYCLRSLKGAVGSKPWQVDCNHTRTGDKYRFTELQGYEDYKKMVQKTQI